VGVFWVRGQVGGGDHAEPNGDDLMGR
jgi:hypothetical protein